MKITNYLRILELVCLLLPSMPVPMSMLSENLHVHKIGEVLKPLGPVVLRNPTVLKAKYFNSIKSTRFWYLEMGNNELNLQY